MHSSFSKQQYYSCTRLTNVSLSHLPSSKECFARKLCPNNEHRQEEGVSSLQAEKPSTLTGTAESTKEYDLAPFILHVTENTFLLVVGYTENKFCPQTHLRPIVFGFLLIFPLIPGDIHLSLFPRLHGHPGSLGFAKNFTAVLETRSQKGKRNGNEGWWEKSWKFGCRCPAKEEPWQKGMNFTLAHPKGQR